MKKYLVFLLFCFSSFNVIAQVGDVEDVYDSDVIQPKFNGGGLDKFHDFLNANFNYSKVRKAGKIVASFTIDSDGNLKNIRIVEFHDSDAAAEMIRVLFESPKWEPAKRGGKPTSVEIKYPMVFTQ